MSCSRLIIGDLVSVQIPQENREWGHNPCPDGTIAKVINFDEIFLGQSCGVKPGIYTNRMWPTLEVDGHSIGEIFYGFLRPLCDTSGRTHDISDDFIRELPRPVISRYELDLAQEMCHDLTIKRLRDSGISEYYTESLKTDVIKEQALRKLIEFYECSQ